jgi:hypothetical protein
MSVDYYKVALQSLARSPPIRGETVNDEVVIAVDPHKASVCLLLVRTDVRLAEVVLSG